LRPVTEDGCKLFSDFCVDLSICGFPGHTGFEVIFMSKQNSKAQNNNNNNFSNSTNSSGKVSQTLNGNGSVKSKSDISGTETLDQKVNKNNNR